jgi:hypothetical protein
MSSQTEASYRVDPETTVGETLFVVLGAEEIFERHGCAPREECTEEHHAEYMLGDLELVCHVDDSLALIDDLNAALESEEAAQASRPVAA